MRPLGFQAFFETLRQCMGNMAYGKTDTELLIKESLIIKQLNPRLNATVKSFPVSFLGLKGILYLFDISISVQFV